MRPDGMPARCATRQTCRASVGPQAVHGAVARVLRHGGTTRAEVLAWLGRVERVRLAGPEGSREVAEAVRAPKSRSRPSEE